jgi:hypothetical protein
MAVAFPCPIMALSKVQRLYDACDLVFSSPAQEAPSLGGIEWLRQLLGKQFVTRDGGPALPVFCTACSCRDIWTQIADELTSLGFRWNRSGRRRHRRRGEVVLLFVGRRAEPQGRPAPPGASVRADHLRAHTPVRRLLGTLALSRGLSSPPVYDELVICALTASCC